MLLAATDRRRLSLAALMAWVWPAIRLKQIVFLRAADGRALGYGTWAYLDRATARRAMEQENGELDLEDWNAGLEVWLVDFVAPFGHARPLARALRTVLGPTRLRALSRRSGRVVRLRL